MTRETIESNPFPLLLDARVEVGKELCYRRPPPPARSGVPPQNADGSVTDIAGCRTTITRTALPSGGEAAHLWCRVRRRRNFEATVSWANSPSPGYQNVDGWPAWWATSVEADSFG
jgi:hypothetical protein